MYGLFPYIRSKMATCIGKCRYIHIPYMEHLGILQCDTVNGWNPAFTSWGEGSLSHYLQGFSTIPAREPRSKNPPTFHESYWLFNRDRSLQWFIIIPIYLGRKVHPRHIPDQQPGAIFDIPLQPRKNLVNPFGLVPWLPRERWWVVVKKRLPWLLLIGFIGDWLNYPVSYIPSLKLTFSHLKMDGWNTSLL